MSVATYYCRTMGYLFGGFLIIGFLSQNVHATTFTKDILSIFKSRCEMCHNANQSQIPNWLDYDTSFKYRTMIKQKAVTDHSMPPGNVTGMTDAERILVAQWIDSGALKDDASPPPSTLCQPGHDLLQLPPTGSRTLTFWQDAYPVIKQRCSLCHEKEEALPHFENYATTVQLKDMICQRALTDETMPPYNLTKLTDEERQTLTWWINTGAVEGFPPESSTLPSLSVSFNGDIVPIFKNRCSLCHYSNSGLLDYLDYDIAFTNRTLLWQQVVIHKSMPINNITNMTDDERLLVKDWIRTGAKGDSCPGQTITYDQIILPLFKKRCSQCHHDGPSTLPNFLDYEVTSRYSGRIYLRVVIDQTMPPNDETYMTDAERKLVADWIHSGTKRQAIFTDTVCKKQ